MSEHDSTTGSGGDWILTFTGRRFYPMAPKAEDVDIIDIAHALSMLCRYAGHSKFFYSVGEHSLWVSHAVPAEHAFFGLMHDAAEAYVCDLPRPLKYALPEYRAAETRVWAAIVEKFGLPLETPPEVKLVDSRMLLTERPVLFDNPQPWPQYAHLTPIDRKIVCAPPHVVFDSFMRRFHGLTGGKYATEEAPRIITPGTIH